jgi:hypothetical protein
MGERLATAQTPPFRWLPKRGMAYIGPDMGVEMLPLQPAAIMGLLLLYIDNKPILP